MREPCDFGWWLRRQGEFQLLEQQANLDIGFGMAGKLQFAAVSGRDLHIDHLHRRELVEHAARGETRCQRVQAPRQGGVQAIGQESDEDVRFDAGLVLMEDWPDGEVAPCLRRGKLLRKSSTVRGVSRTSTSRRAKR